MAALFFRVTKGIPSHDTLSNVIGRINRDAFALAFGEWVKAGLPALAGHQVAIDNKSLRDSRGEDTARHTSSEFGEDAHSTRKGHSAANHGLIRRIVLNLLQQDNDRKISIRRRKMLTLVDLNYP